MMDKIKKVPDFIIVGAAKAGTTSLYTYLSQHPAIFMPQNKEPSYFALIGKKIEDYYYPAKMTLINSAVSTVEDYSRLFASATPNQLCGEASTIYLSDPDAAKYICSQLPKAKLIVVLRNPIDRAYSHFIHHRSDNYEPEKDFLSACDAEPERIANHWHPDFFYKRKGLYSEQIKKYQELFPKDQIKIFLYEELKNSALVVRQIFEFLGVDPTVEVDTTAIYNLSGEFRFPWLYHLIRRSSIIKPNVKQVVPTKQWNKVKKIWDSIMVIPPKKMSEKERSILREYFRDDIMKLSILINRDLSHWLA
jgi:hypothetical protein